MQETIKNINIDLLIPFENHPFKKRDGIENEELKESVRENGLLEPIIVRSFPPVLTKLSAVTGELKLAKNWEYKPFRQWSKICQKMKRLSQWWIQIYRENIYCQAKKPLLTK